MVFAKTTLIKEHPMCHYHHLTLIEREKIMFFRAQGKNLSVIAKELGRSKVTISRELRRNGSDTLYIPAMAHKQYRTRRKKCRPHKKLDTPTCLLSSRTNSSNINGRRKKSQDVYVWKNIAHPSATLRSTEESMQGCSMRRSDPAALVVQHAT